MTVLAQYIGIYVLTLIALGILDFLWARMFARSIYQSTIGHLSAPSWNWTALTVSYLIVAAGLSLFAIFPALRGGTATGAAIFGAFVGFLIYGTHSFVNYALLRDWPFRIAIVGLLWGTFLGAVVAFIIAGISTSLGFTV